MTVSRRTVLAALATGLAGGAGSHALASAKPAPVAGTDPGGIAIAVLGSGIDYRHPGLAQRLARDGEGDLIGWDFVTNDNRPYEVPPGGGLVVPGVPGAGLTGAGTAAGLLLANLAPAARLVAVRENPSDPAALGRMMSFVSQTAATLVVWPSADAKRPDLAILPLAADRFADRLMIVPMRDASAPFQAASQRANVLLVAGSDDRPMRSPRGFEPLIVARGDSRIAGDAVTASLRVAALAARLAAANPRLLAGADGARTLAARIKALAQRQRDGRMLLTIAAEPALNP